jgi:hypothetical protein
VAVDQVPVRHVDEDLVAVVRRRRVRLVVATEKIERGVLQAGLGTTDQNRHGKSFFRRGFYADKATEPQGVRNHRAIAHN